MILSKKGNSLKEPMLVIWYFSEEGDPKDPKYLVLTKGTQKKPQVSRRVPLAVKLTYRTLAG